MSRHVSCCTLGEHGGMSGAEAAAWADGCHVQVPAVYTLLEDDVHHSNNCCPSGSTNSHAASEQKEKPAQRNVDQAVTKLHTAAIPRYTGAIWHTAGAGSSNLAAR